MLWTSWLLVTIWLGASCCQCAIDIHLRQMYRHQHDQTSSSIKELNELTDLANFAKTSEQQRTTTNMVVDVARCNNHYVLSIESSSPTDANGDSSNAPISSDCRISSSGSGSSSSSNSNSNEKSRAGEMIAGGTGLREPRIKSITSGGAIDAASGRMLQELFGVESPPPPPLPPFSVKPTTTEMPTLLSAAGDLLPAVAPINLPTMFYNDFYEDLLVDAKPLDVKRAKSTSGSCDCKVTNDIIDLGHQHFPRYLLNAVCQPRSGSGVNGVNELEPKCWSGAVCKPLEYKVKVLTFRIDNVQRDPVPGWLPDDLRHLWKFKTVTVIAGCFCSEQRTN